MKLRWTFQNSRLSQLTQTWRQPWRRVDWLKCGAAEGLKLISLALDQTCVCLRSGGSFLKFKTYPLYAGDSKGDDWSWWGGHSCSGSHGHCYGHQERNNEAKNGFQRQPPFPLFPSRPSDRDAAFPRKSCWSKRWTMICNRKLYFLQLFLTKNLQYHLHTVCVGVFL